MILLLFMYLKMLTFEGRAGLKRLHLKEPTSKPAVGLSFHSLDMLSLPLLETAGDNS